MRSVRCDGCGAKALMAASTCPTCGHPFDVRDGFGELRPLSYCATCESYYPESNGSCRWCGTQPERPPINPRIWKRVGVAACVVLVGITWVLRDVGPHGAAASRKTAQKSPDTAVVASRSVAPPAESAPADTVAPPVTIASADTIRRDTTSVPSAPTAPSVAANDTTLPMTTLAKPAAPRWVNSISKDWVVVRADASKQARIVASLGPSSRVQLGESRGTWRRIKARGIAGWVEPRSIFVAVPPPKKAGALSAR